MNICKENVFVTNIGAALEYQCHSALQRLPFCYTTLFYGADRLSHVRFISITSFAVLIQSPFLSFSYVNWDFNQLTYLTHPRINFPVQIEAHTYSAAT